MMPLIQKLRSLKLSDDAMITFTYEEGADVLHYNETEVETAIAETSVISEFASLIANSRLNVQHQWCGNILEHLRTNDYLEDYVRGSFEFEDFLVEAITDNFYDVDLIDHSTEKYDHKRGFTTLTAQVQIPYTKILEEAPFLSGWVA
jgi:hypothetical protein